MNDLVTDKKYLTHEFSRGTLNKATVQEITNNGSWMVSFESTSGSPLVAMTRRGENRVFSSFDTAARYCRDIGFSTAEIVWKE